MNLLMEIMTIVAAITTDLNQSLKESLNKNHALGSGRQRRQEL